MPDVGVHESRPVNGTPPAEDNDLVQDPPQEPPRSPQAGMLELDERTEDPPPEHIYSPLPLPSPHDPDDEGRELDDDDAAPGREAQPDNLPGGPNDWNPDDLVPHLDVLKVSVDFIKGIQRASLHNDPLPDNVQECLRSPSTTFPLIDDDL
jgi:hypothetical protein